MGQRKPPSWHAPPSRPQHGRSLLKSKTQIAREKARQEKAKQEARRNAAVVEEKERLSDFSKDMGGSKTKLKAKVSKTQYADLPDCEVKYGPANPNQVAAEGIGNTAAPREHLLSTKLGGCMERRRKEDARVVFSPSLMQSGKPFRFHECKDTAFNSLEEKKSRRRAKNIGEEDCYSPRLMTAFRFRMMEWAAAQSSFSFLLFLDLNPPTSGLSGAAGGRFGFLCLPSLVAELEHRPHERFLWQKCDDCDSTGPSVEFDAGSPKDDDDSFLLMSRDVVELLRFASRRAHANLIFLDRLLFRLPLTTLQDPLRLASADSTADGALKSDVCMSFVWLPGICISGSMVDGDPLQCELVDSTSTRAEIPLEDFKFPQSYPTIGPLDCAHDTLGMCNESFQLPAATHK
jgi:hypothetical protein